MNNNPFYDPTLKRRHLLDKIFKATALSALLVCIAFLVIFLQIL